MLEFNVVVVYVIVLLVITFQVTEWTPFRNLCFMYFILKTKYTLSLKFVPAQVQLSLEYQSGTTKNLELSHPKYTIRDHHTSYFMILHIYGIT
jgi:hypothetical protein